MYKVKILGAGSIGNHLANASRRLGWSVALCDSDAAALERTRTEIYPARYGKWDDAIELYQIDDAPRSGFDIIMIGTPPDSHLPLAMEAIKENPKAVMVEKPLCTPTMEGAEKLGQLALEHGVTVFVGYDHVVGKAAAVAMDAACQLSQTETLDVEFREHWGGIFAAHPWLAGPQDSYLGFWERGGGACGEHSHAINLWQHFARGVGAGRITEVSAYMDYVQTGGVSYDKLCLLNVRTEVGLTGRVVQDVITSPPRKWARVQGDNGYVELNIGAKPGVDSVQWKHGNAETQTHLVEKTRADDFVEELKHIATVLQEGDSDSVIRLERGLETMLVISAAHLSARERRNVQIDYEAGFTTDALRLI